MEPKKERKPRNKERKCLTCNRGTRKGDKCALCSKKNELPISILEKLKQPLITHLLMKKYGLTPHLEFYPLLAEYSIYKDKYSQLNQEELIQLLINDLKQNKLWIEKNS